MPENENLIYAETLNCKKWAYYLSPIALLPIIIEYFTDKITPDDVIAASILLLVFILIGFGLTLKWTISKDAFSFKYPPFYNKWRKIPLSEIKKMEIMRINPLKEFGGWGFRYGKLGQAFTTTGRMIIHIETTSGQKMNFSVENTEKAVFAINEFRNNSL